MYHVESILVEIENIDFSNDKSLTEFLINNTPMLVKNVYKAINQLYDAVQLINNSGSTLQAILGPQFNKLKPQFDRAYEQLMEFTSKGVESINGETLGENIGTKISLLPKNNTRVEDISFDDLGSLIHSIPDYLKKLEDLIDNNPYPEKANMNTEEYQCVLEKRANKLGNDLDQLTTKTSLSLSYQYIQILKQLGALALDVVNAGASLNKSAYKKAVTKLNKFKHLHLPKIISELELLEENFGLKTGTLTKNTLDSANKYYQKLAESVDKMAVVAGIFDKIELHGNRLYGQLAQKIVLGDSKKIVTGKAITRDEQITTLFDPTFIEKRQMLQLERLNSAKEHLHEAQESEKAAIAFFEKLDKVNKFYKQKYFSSMSIEDRQELAHLYQQFQSYITEIDPAFDQKMVHYLTLTTKEEEQIKQGKKVTSSFLGSVLGGMSTLTGFSIAVVNNVITPFIPSPEKEFNLVLQKQNQ
ncbi:MAG: hypothetical protein HYX60_04505, partial [Legionella longbeachae]|nr:hypothetical protein [Legionella longbeachae]